MQKISVFRKQRSFPLVIAMVGGFFVLSLCASIAGAAVTYTANTVAGDTAGLTISTTGVGTVISNTAGNTTFSTAVATDDKIVIAPNTTGAGATFTGTLTSADLTGAAKTWTLPDATGTVSLVTGTETLTNKTLTAPRIANAGFLADANGNELTIYTTTAAAVNEFTLINAATGVAPILSASGGDALVNMELRAKGASDVMITTTVAGADHFHLRPQATGVAAAFNGILTTADITGADKTWTFPNVTGTVVTTGDTGSVTTGLILDGTILTGDIAADTILAGNIATGAVATAEILDGTILAGDLAAGAVVTAGILDGTILTGDIAADTILAGNIATGAVATAEILDGTILVGDLADGAVTTGKILDGTIANGDLAAGTFANVTGTGTLTAGATGAGFTVALTTSTVTGNLQATRLQAAAADLGAADVTVNLGNTNGAFNTNVTTDGTVTATTFIGALTGTASLATALAADPADCGANTFATTIAASGALTCAAVASAAITDGTIANGDLAAGTFANVTGTGTLTAGATGAGFTVALGASTITGTLPVANGGTGNAFFTVSGPATSAKTYTFPNADSTVAVLGTAQTYTAERTFATATGTDDTLIARPFAGGAGRFSGILTSADLTADRTYTLPDVTGNVALDTGGATTGNVLLETEIDASAELLALMDDETGTGALVFANTPTLVSPVLGVATGTSLATSNQNIFTAAAGTGPVLARSATATDDDLILLPQAGGAGRFAGTITSADLTANRTWTFPNTTGTFTVTGDNLSVFAATTSAQLIGVLSDETGTGAAVFATSPTITTGTYRGSSTFDSVTATEDRILLSIAAAGAGRFDGTITNADLTANRTWTFPDATGTVSLLGNTSTGTGSVVLSAGPTFTGNIKKSVTNTITAAGTVQGDATALTTDYNMVTTVAASTGVRLPTAVAGMTVVVTNRGANTLNVWPAVGDTINAAAMDAAKTYATSTTAFCYSHAATFWECDTLSR